MLNETLEFRFQYILELAKNENDLRIKENISEAQVKSIKFFIKESPFKVLECDKKTGAIIISKDNEILLANKCLNDSVTYEKIPSDPLDSTCQEISNYILSLVSDKLISEKLGKLLINKEAKLGKFRVLTKIHKKNSFGIRPIINSMNSPTNKICLFIFLVLQPIVNQSESYLQDSQHLLQIFSKFNSNRTLKERKKCFLYSCDFEALYTNINLDLALTLIMETIIEFNILDQKMITPQGFKVLLGNVFNFNVFSFDNDFYRQIKGIAMGAICGPAIANIVVYKLERKWLPIHRPILYKRFIDDIFILSEQEIDEENFQSFFKDLKLNIIKNSHVQFLDLDISFNYFFNRIETKLYIKPTNTFSYLSSLSNHKKSIFKNIPKSIFIRARRICSSYLEYLKFSRIFYFQLLDRGYKSKTLSAIIRQIGKLDRNELIEYKNKAYDFKDLEKKNNFWLTFDFFNFNFNFNNILHNAWNNLNLCCERINKLDLKLNLANTNMNNLKKIFLHGAKLSLKNFNFSCKPCKEPLCISCHFFKQKNFFRINNLCIPVMNNCNCKSRNCIYIIFCSLCDAFYIGETSRTLEERFTDHLHTIRKFVPIFNEFSEIATHFNLCGHNYYTHLNISIFACNISDVFKRRQIESELIHIFLTLGCKMINKKIYCKFSNFFTSI